MDRRTFNKLAVLAAMGTLPEGPRAASQQSASATATTAIPAGAVTLEDKDLEVVFDTPSGALIRMRRKSTGWMIQRRAEQAMSFRLHAPLPGRRDNFVLGEKQRAVKVEKISGTRVDLEWSNMVSEHGGTLPLALKAAVTLENGALAFQGTLINNSNLTVESVEYPYFGDLTAPEPGGLLETEHMWYGNLVGGEIYPRFNNSAGYWGVKCPHRSIDSKQSLFCLIQAASEGVYVGMHDASVPYFLQYTFEQRPGTLESVNNPVPQGGEIGGVPVHLEFRACHLVFAHPQSTKEFAPIVLGTYDGDWHAGVDLYKQWRATWFKAPRVAEWAKEVHSWQQLRADGAEEDFRVPYREVTEYAAECAKNGVTAIQLVGWNHGGQDRGDPSQDTDPGLGSWNDLHDAIAKSQAMGVKIVLFAKLHWADLTTDLYKDELYKYASTDPYGIPYQQGGYSYTTPTQLAGINNRRRAVMDMLCPAWRDRAEKEFQKILALGAAGWLFDEVCHHGPVDYSFDENHGYTPPGYIYAGDLPMAERYRKAADQVNPDFLFAGEGPQDWLMQYYPVSYFRINGSSRPVCRYIDPQAPLMVAVTGFDDREMLNLILLNRYIISYEPYYFKGHLTDFPMTLAYGKKIDALRRKYKAQLWDAEFRDTVGARVTADGSHRYSVFVTSTGKRTVVVINQEPQHDVTATVQLPNATNLVVATPEEPDARSSAGIVQIPARSAAVLMEA